MSKIIGIVGGDLRITKLTKLFAEDNYKVYTYGLEQMEIEETFKDKIMVCKNIKELSKQSNNIISSIPLSRDEKAIYTPFSKNMLYVDEMFEELKGKTFICRRYQRICI